MRGLKLEEGAAGCYGGTVFVRGTKDKGCVFVVPLSIYSPQRLYCSQVADSEGSEGLGVRGESE